VLGGVGVEGEEGEEAEEVVELLLGVAVGPESGWMSGWPGV